MSEPRKKSLENNGLGLSSFGDVSGDQGLSLESLGESFARLLGQGEDPYQPNPPPNQGVPNDEAQRDDHETGGGGPVAEDPACSITPRSILEAILFVGHPQNEALTSRQIADLMRGVRPAEVDQLVRQLNAAYADEGCPYFIQSAGAGYRFALREKYHPLPEKFYRKIREARLSQPAIDVLAIVAYHQPIVREEVNRLRGKPSAGILSQLVRRRLLRIARHPDRPRTAQYSTTHRFLKLFGLESLEELPRSQELNPND